MVYPLLHCKEVITPLSLDLHEWCELALGPFLIMASTYTGGEGAEAPATESLYTCVQHRRVYRVQHRRVYRVQHRRVYRVQHRQVYCMYTVYCVL